jgi:uncharacterized protein (TIGR00266 family)
MQPKRKAASKKGGNANAVALPSTNAPELKAHIVGAPGSNYLEVDLPPGFLIKSSPGSLVYLRGDVEKGAVELGGVGKALARAFGGQDMFITAYRGGQSAGGKVAFGSPLPGDIIRIDLGPREAVIVSRGSFLCCTADLEVTATTRLKGIIGVGQGEGFVLPVIQAGEVGGAVWLCAYGTFKRIDLAANEKIVLDNGTFLACPVALQYKIVRLGKTLFSSLAGGEGFGMEFVGPAALYMQSKNVNEFMGYIGAHSQSVSGGVKDGIGRGIGEGLFRGLFGSNQQGGEEKNDKKGKGKKSTTSRKGSREPYFL